LLKNYTFTLKNVIDGETEKVKVKAHAFPEAASKVYLLSHPKRTDGWCIISGVDEACNDS
jgi:hypothetical protein